MANVDIQVGKKDSTFFSANPTLVLKNGQLIYNETTSELFIGDGVTQLSSLVAINGGGSQDLASVLSNGNTTNELSIKSQDLSTTLSVLNDEFIINKSTANISISSNGNIEVSATDSSLTLNGTAVNLVHFETTEIVGGNGTLNSNLTDLTVSHADLINLNATNVKKNNVEIATVNDIVQVNTSTIGSAINGATSATPNDTDLVMSVDTSVAKKNTWTQIKSFLKSYFDTVYQAAGSYLTSANITQVITNGVTNKAPSEDAVFDALALKSNISSSTTTVVKDITASSTLTGTTSITLIKSVLVPANTITVSDIVQIQFRAVRDTATNNASHYLYYNTSASLSGATLIATHTAAARYFATRRNLFVLASNNTETVASGLSSANDDATAPTSAQSFLNIDWTVDQYIIQAFQNAAIGDSTTSRGMFIKRVR